MVMSHENTLTIALLISVNKGEGTAKRNTPFNHCVILCMTQRLLTELKKTEFN